jgi:hypothetical protein
MCRLSWNLGVSTSWNPRGLSKPVMGLLSPWTVISSHIAPPSNNPHNSLPKSSLLYTILFTITLEVPLQIAVTQNGALSKLGCISINPLPCLLHTSKYSIKFLDKVGNRKWSRSIYNSLRKNPGPISYKNCKANHYMLNNAHHFRCLRIYHGNCS